MIKIKKTGSFNFNKISARQKDTNRVVLTKIGNNSVNHFKSGFRIGGKKTDDSKTGWEKRQIETKRGRATLVQSGKLRRSIRFKRQSFDAIVIQSHLPYSKIHNIGGRVKLSSRQKSFFWHKHIQAKRRGRKREAEYYKNLALKKTSIKIPKREYIGDSKILDRKNLVIIRNEYKKLMTI